MTTVDSRLTPSMVSNSSATPARVALLGFGTVGQSVARILCSGEIPQVQLTHIFNRQVARKRVDWVPASVDLDRIGRRRPRGRRRHRHRAGRRPAPGIRLGQRRADGGQVGRDRQQAADGAPRHRAPRSRAVARARGAVRSVGRRRHSGAARAAGRAGGRSARRSARHSERHLRLHPEPHAVGDDLVRRRARRSAARRLRGSGSERGSRRRRRRGEAGDHCRRRVCGGRSA